MHDIIGVLLGLILGGMIGWQLRGWKDGNSDNDDSDGYSLPGGRAV